MRQSLPLPSLLPQTREFIVRFRIRKNYPYTDIVTIGEIIEILLGSPVMHHDTSFEGSLVFDTILDLQELKIGFDGDSLLDMLLFYLDNYIVDRVRWISGILERERGDLNGNT